MPVLIFDCETVPDFLTLRRLLDLPPDTPDDATLQEWEAQGKNTKLKPALQQVVAVAAAWIEDNGRLGACKALGSPASEEADLVREFFRVVEGKRPRLAGWNTNGFDLPLLIARAMVHGIAAPGFYAVGGDYKGYRKRYDEENHIDLMDLLANYGASTALKLDEMAAVLGIPGKLGTDGSMVLDLWRQGEIGRIRDYCETDVLTTALVYGRYAHHRGWWDEAKWTTFDQSVREFLAISEREHWRKFREAWKPETAVIGGLGMAMVEDEP